MSERRQPFYHRRHRAKAALHNRPRQCDGGNPATTAVALRWRNPASGNSLPPTRTNWPAFPLIVYVIFCVKRCIYEDSREKQKTSTKTLACSHGFHVSVTVSREVRHARSCERTRANMRDDKTATREAEGGMRWIYSVKQKFTIYDDDLNGF